MEIKLFNAAKLLEFVDSKQFQDLPVIPISTLRAHSHANNPRLEANDCILITAWEENLLVGYLGVLADWLKNDQNAPIKCGWLSCMWVDETQRGKGIAKKMLQQAFEQWNDCILVTEFTPEAKILYDRSQHFQDFGEKKGLRCYYQFPLAEILPRKKSYFLKIKFLLKGLDFTGNKILNFQRNLFASNFKTDWKEITNLDQQHAVLIKKWDETLENRTLAELNWLLKNPWIQAGEVNFECKKYHFSLVANPFLQLIFELEKTALLIITIKNNQLKVPYFWGDEKAAKSAVGLLLGLLKKYNLTVLIVYHPLLMQEICAERKSFLFIKNTTRFYIITQTLRQQLGKDSKFNFQDGDADCGFT